MRITLTQYRREDLKQYAVNYFNQMKDMLFSFDIKSSPIKIDKGNERKDGTRTICTNERMGRERYVLELL